MTALRVPAPRRPGLGRRFALLGDAARLVAALPQRT